MAKRLAGILINKFRWWFSPCRRCKELHVRNYIRNTWEGEQRRKIWDYELDKERRLER